MEEGDLIGLNAAVADLQKTRDTALSNLQAEEAQIKPTYEAQRSTANANNRVAARNFQEYLANTGRANSGIGAQYEMSRQNSLQNGLNSINAAEAQSIADIARRRTDAQNAYNSGLASANAQVEANYIQNLLNQAQQQWEREFAQKQFNEQVRQYNLNRQDALRKSFSSGGGSSSRSTSSGKKTTKKTAINNNNNKTSNNQDYAVKAVRSPNSFSDDIARKYYVSAIQPVASRSQLDYAITQGLKKGYISQSDADNIYNVFGIS